MMEALATILAPLAMFLSLSLLVSLPLMLLWNWLIAGHFGLLQPLTFFQAFGLLLLINFLKGVSVTSSK